MSALNSLYIQFELWYALFFIREIDDIADTTQDPCLDIEHGTNCKSFDTVLQAATVVKPPVIISEHDPIFFQSRRLHAKCWEFLFKGLLKLGYEFRVLPLEASEYGCVTPQQRLILVASRIGLPGLPSILPM